MVKKNIKDLEYKEEDECLSEEQDEVEEKPKFANSPLKPKRTLTDKQKEALARGREKGRQKLVEKHTLQNKVKAVNKEVKQLKQEELIKKTDDLEKFADVSYIRKSVEALNNKFGEIHNRFESIDNRFVGYLSEREQRKKDKQGRVLEETIRKELPRTVSDIYLKQKISQELSNNPYLGRV